VTSAVSRAALALRAIIMSFRNPVPVQAMMVGLVPTKIVARDAFTIPTERANVSLPETTTVTGPLKNARECVLVTTLPMPQLSYVMLLPMMRVVDRAVSRPAVLIIPDPTVTIAANARAILKIVKRATNFANCAKKNVPMNTKTVNEPMLWAMNSNSVVSFLMMDKANQCCENWNDRVGF